MIPYELLKKTPKIELHCHLDGSLSDLALLRILTASEDNRITKFNQLKSKMQAPELCKDLADYLTCFGYAVPLLQTAKNLQIAAYELIRQVALENVIYIEVRLAPLLHCQEGLTQTKVVQAVLTGLALGERDFGVKSRVLLSMLRGRELADNLTTLQCAKAMREDGVVGIDLAGNEAAYPPELYGDLFEKALAWQIPFTIHAGECGSADNVRTAIAMGATRIGHGVAIMNHKEIKDLCRNNGITLEMCPVSNMQTGAVKEIQNYPFRKMVQEGLSVTINTDNRTVSNTSLVREWMLLEQNFTDIDMAILQQSGLNAIEAAFLSKLEKDNLQKTLLHKLDNIGGLKVHEL